jgi:hypothetical protein
MSLQILFSGASTKDGVQTNSDKCLGGFISCSPAPNNAINELFSDISLLGQMKNSVEVKAFFIKNIGAKKINLKFFFQREQTNATDYSFFEVCFVNPLNENQIEVIPSIRSSPQNGTFYDEMSIGNIGSAIILGDFNPNQTLGMWLRRTIVYNERIAKFTTPDILKTFQETEFIVKSEKISLVFDWD